MISILIPTYNWDITPLVYELQRQLEKAKLAFEIISIDDASGSEMNLKNKEINASENCTFFSLERNIGRSAIRNLLIEKSSYEWLLFLDADVLPASDKFIQKYIDYITKTELPIIVGGIAYKKNKYSHYLRYKLGKNTEEFLDEIRNTNPYKYLFTGNFLIKKTVFRLLKFDKSLTQYGYEDLLFAKELERNNIIVKHIDNQVFHLGIDEDEKFIVKTKKALTNMAFLLKKNKICFEDTRISNAYKKLNFFWITFLLSWFVTFFEKQAIKKSSITYFNLFRLAYLHQILHYSK